MSAQTSRRRRWQPRRCWFLHRAAAGQGSDGDRSGSDETWTSINGPAGVGISIDLSVNRSIDGPKAKARNGRKWERAYVCQRPEGRQRIRSFVSTGCCCCAGAVGLAQGGRWHGGVSSGFKCPLEPSVRQL